MRSIHLAAMLAATDFAFSIPFISLPQAPSSGAPDHHRKIHRSKYLPHQGKRECARRLKRMKLEDLK